MSLILLLTESEIITPSPTPTPTIVHWVDVDTLTDDQVVSIMANTNKNWPVAKNAKIMRQNLLKLVTNG